MTDCLSVYVTAPTPDEAEKIAHAVVEENLAACANIFPSITSIYSWQGKAERSHECVLILKTTKEKFEALQTRIKQLHSHDCPCIVATKIKTGNPDYLNWIEGSLQRA